MKRLALIFFIVLLASYAYADCTQTGTCTHTFPKGSAVILAETPNPGSVFVKWKGDQCADSTAPTCVVVMPMDSSRVNVSAEFKSLIPDAPNIIFKGR